MIPGEFIYRESFPLTPNGKVDRLALASEERVSQSGGVTIGTQEERILQLWSEILGQAVSDPEANFFDLGGTSIHLAVVHVRLREMSGKDLAITDLFARPSARALAELLSPRSTATRSAAQDRARLQHAGLARFRRPSPR
jgi:hypothetical protein